MIEFSHNKPTHRTGFPLCRFHAGLIMDRYDNFIASGFCYEPAGPLCVRPILMKRIFSLFAICVISNNVSARIVTWSTETGGNNQRYEVVTSRNLSWKSANALATASGGYLATIASEEENNFIISLLRSPEYWVQYPDLNVWLGPWIGGFQFTPNARDEGWQWVTGEPFVFADWGPGQPDDFGADQDRLHFWAFDTTLTIEQIIPKWDDLGNSQARVTSYIVEYHPVPEPATGFYLLLSIPLALLSRRAYRRTLRSSESPPAGISATCALEPPSGTAHSV